MVVNIIPIKLLASVVGSGWLPEHCEYPRDKLRKFLCSVMPFCSHKVLANVAHTCTRASPPSVRASFRINFYYPIIFVKFPIPTESIHGFSFALIPADEVLHLHSTVV